MPILRLSGYERRDDGFFVVMERPTPFCDLFDFISDRGTVEETLARSLFRQVVETTIACKLTDIVRCVWNDETRFLFDMSIVLSHQSSSLLVGANIGVLHRDIKGAFAFCLSEFVDDDRHRVRLQMRT